jgi:hypothetical protein
MDMSDEVVKYGMMLNLVGSMLAIVVGYKARGCERCVAKAIYTRYTAWIFVCHSNKSSGILV